MFGRTPCMGMGWAFSIFNTHGNCAWRRHVCKHWIAGRRGLRRCQLAAQSGLARMPGEAGPGDWPHGWQFHASRTCSLYFRGRVPLAGSEPLLLSQSGSQAGEGLARERCAGGRAKHSNAFQTPECFANPVFGNFEKHYKHCKIFSCVLLQL